MCRSALQRFPGENNIACLLGAVLVRQRRPQEAESLLREITLRVPEFAKAHDELANSMLAQNEPQRAIASLEKVIELEPENEFAKFKLNEILTEFDQGGNESNTTLDETERTLLNAAHLRTAGDFPAAETCYQSVLARDPDNAHVYQLLGNLAFEQQQYADAAVLFKRALKLAPENVSAWMDLGNVQAEREHFDDALGALEKAIVLQPDSALLQKTLGSVHSKKGQYAEAIAALKAALKLQPDNTDCLIALGNACRTVGQADAAIAAYRQAATSNPASGDAWWSLANLKRYSFDENEIRTMKAQLADEQLIGAERTALHFAMGKAAEDSGDFGGAFHLFADGNKLRRAVEQYDPVANQEATERLISVFDAELLEMFRDETQRAARSTPVFIVGMPRSGSTLVEQILASHSQVDGTRELPHLDQVIRGLESRTNKAYPDAVAAMNAGELRRLGETYIELTHVFRANGTMFTDKTPGNFRHIGLLQLILPEAKIINVYRHPLDTSLGCFKQLFASGQPWSYDLFEIAEFYLEYQRLMDHWHALVPGKVLDVAYENLVSNLDDQVHTILEYCGLEFEQGCLEFYNSDRAVESASSEQVRQPIYQSSVDNWRRYEPYVEELVEILRPIIA